MNKARVNLPNFISLLRLPLALIFIVESTSLRLTILFLALLTDGLDGWLARKLNQQTKFGAMLDPATDKFFVAVALATLFTLHPLPLWQIIAFFSRDVALLIYGIFLVLKRQEKNPKVQSIWPGKISTVLQFATLGFLTLNQSPPFVIWIAFIMLGIAFLLSLLNRKPSSSLEML